ncbi:hypothetical protein E4U09_001686 [Claviceps aff. purpurea]|uniref:Nucleoporin NSP1 n=1 Tax=Claviceps aff. purpurea TaxID=1967640 RepID=A0A9P7QIV6_9HYPO|nr:hypothetical protein E4U09_001686 [Claviceps aff. purpurea]
MSQNPFGAPNPFGAAAGNATNTATDGPPKFSFASPGGNSSNAPSSNSGGSVFGQKPSEDAQKPAGSTFGSAFSSAFGSTPGGSGSAIIGGNFSSGGSFGGGNKSFGSGGPLSGGSGGTESSSGGLFGGATTGAAKSGTSMFGDPYKPSTSTPFSAFGATPKSQSSTPAAEPSSSSFGNTGSSVFGTQPKTDSAADTQSATTPAKPSLFMPSTTPAGAPSTTTTESASAPGTSATSLFGGAAAKPASSDSASSLFGGKQADTGSSATSLFGKKDAPPSSASSLFGAATSNAAPATSSTASPTKTTPDSASSLFGAKVGEKASEKASSSAATESTPAPSSTDASSTSKSMFSMFGGGGAKSKDTPATDEPSAGPSTSAASLFGAKTATDTAAKNGDESKGEAKPANQTTEATALGMSTTGPISEMARLKNKTMEDIVTRWASDLTKYQKEFKEQATAVSSWDCNLVNNGEKIQKLYLDTFEAERASHEIERQLAAVESQQEELEAWLNRYESEMQDMFAKQIGPGEQLAGPDQERERTYKLAEKLTQHLDEKSRDLSKMVKEINDISGTLSKGPKTEDALSQIVRVLNGHLTQLQWIDQNASALQAKVTMAQKSNSSLGNHYAGPGTDAAESFYRSYYGRR